MILAFVLNRTRNHQLICTLTISDEFTRDTLAIRDLGPEALCRIAKVSTDFFPLWGSPIRMHFYNGPDFVVEASTRGSHGADPHCVQWAGWLPPNKTAKSGERQ